MKSIIPLALFALFFTSLFFGSCTKEILKEVVVTDTVKINTNTNTITHDTTKYIIGMDSVKVDFTYAISYQPDSLSSAILKANDGSKNVPSNAIYTWILDGIIQTTQINTYIGIDFGKIYNGPHILSMSIYCPDIKRNFTVAKTFSIKLKG